MNELNTEKAIFVVPKAVAENLSDSYKTQLVIIGNGESTKQLGISISAIPMYNLPEADDSRHPKGRGNGYILELGGEKVYISGDTEDIQEMRSLKNIDLAFVCMNLPFTMDVNQAASAVLEFKPGIVYPYHYRGQDTEQFRNLVRSKSDEIEVRLRNWYPD
ncbi:MAG: MBL fold metallo-hydrolase [Balneolaceae bacterium]|nr:MBL fold metallo-hydrolase [Balneolaceae bacterium]